MNAASEDERNEIEDLLPWHAAGTLSAREAQAVEAALAHDPELVRRCFWRAIALRPPHPSGNDPSFAYEQAASSLAIRLARFDRGVARQVLEPAARRVRALDYGRRSWARILFAAAALIDPAWAVSLADSLRDDQPAANLHPKTSMRRPRSRTASIGRPWQKLRSLLSSSLPFISKPDGR